MSQVAQGQTAHITRLPAILHQVCGNVERLCMTRACYIPALGSPRRSDFGSWEPSSSRFRRQRQPLLTIGAQTALLQSCSPVFVAQAIHVSNGKERRPFKVISSPSFMRPCPLRTRVRAPTHMGFTHGQTTQARTLHLKQQRNRNRYPAVVPPESSCYTSVGRNGLCAPLPYKPRQQPQAHEQGAGGTLR